MALFTLTIADPDVPRVISALCTNFGYTVVSTDNALAGVMAYIAETVANVERREAFAALPAIVPVDIS